MHDLLGNVPAGSTVSSVSSFQQVGSHLPADESAHAAHGGCCW